MHSRIRIIRQYETTLAPWLAHQKLDAAVFMAYDWDSAMEDEKLRAKLLELHLERAKHDADT